MVMQLFSGKYILGHGSEQTISITFDAYSETIFTVEDGIEGVAVNTVNGVMC